MNSRSLLGYCFALPFKTGHKTTCLSKPFIIRIRPHKRKLTWLLSLLFPSELWFSHSLILHILFLLAFFPSSSNDSGLKLLFLFFFICCCACFCTNSSAWFTSLTMSWHLVCSSFSKSGVDASSLGLIFSKGSSHWISTEDVIISVESSLSIFGPPTYVHSSSEDSSWLFPSVSIICLSESVSWCLK